MAVAARTLVPEWLQDDPLVVALCTLIDRQVTDLAAARGDVKAQFVLDTLTWGLDRMEQVVGLTYNPALTGDQRRQRVQAVLYSAATATAQAVRAMANRFENGDTETHMDWEAYVAHVRFVDVFGRPTNLSDLEDQLLRMLPAEVSVVFDLRYLVVSELADTGMTVAALAATGMTVEQLMTWRP